MVQILIEFNTFALLREKDPGRAGAVDEFRDFCKLEGVEHGWDSWT